MSVDLSFVPLEAEGKFPSGQSVLHCCNGRHLQELISANVPLFRAPIDLSCHLSQSECGDTRYGVINYDAFGNLVQCALARDLAALDISDPVARSGQNPAVWAYLKSLPPETKVAIIYF